MNHDAMMRLAIEEAQKALLHNDVPVGAVLAIDNTVVATAHNQREQLGDPTAHAELLCIQQAAKQLGTRRLQEATLYVTLEPCPMCAGALIMAQIQRCYFGASDARQGCCESLYALPKDPAFFHRLPCIGGLLEAECARLLTQFFSSKRNTKERTDGIT